MPGWGRAALVALALLADAVQAADPAPGLMLWGGVQPDPATLASLGAEPSVLLPRWGGPEAAVRAADLQGLRWVLLPLQDFLAAPALRYRAWQLREPRELRWYWTGRDAPTGLLALLARVEAQGIGAVALAVPPADCALALAALDQAFSADPGVSRPIAQDWWQRGVIAAPACDRPLPGGTDSAAGSGRALLLLTPLGEAPIGSQPLDYLNQGRRLLDGLVLLDLQAPGDRQDASPLRPEPDRLFRVPAAGQ